MLTKEEKAQLRGHWKGLQLLFLTGGYVMARPLKTSAWSILYTPGKAKPHLESLKKLGIIKEVRP